MNTANLSLTIPFSGTTSIQAHTLAIDKNSERRCITSMRLYTDFQVRCPIL